MENKCGNRRWIEMALPDLELRYNVVSLIPGQVGNFSTLDWKKIKDAPSERE